jgi:hypothetical protein
MADWQRMTAFAAAGDAFVQIEAALFAEAFRSANFGQLPAFAHRVTQAHRSKEKEANGPGGTVVSGDGPNQPDRCPTGYHH